jgi:hypothetical protein
MIDELPVRRNTINMARRWVRRSIEKPTGTGIPTQITAGSIHRIIEVETRKHIYEHEVVIALRVEGLKPAAPAEGQRFYDVVFKPDYRLPEGLIFRGSVHYWNITYPQCSIVPSGNKGYEGVRL